MQATGTWKRHLANALLLAILGAALIACDDGQMPDPPSVEQTASPVTASPPPATVATPVLSPSATRAQTASPTPSPTLTPTAQPTEEPGAAMTIADYAAHCSALRDTFNLDADAVAESGEDYSWAEVATVLDFVHESYASLKPPAELDDYHGAALDFIKAYGDVARSRPADQSFVQGYSLFAFSVFPGLVQIAQDEGKTEEQRTEQADAFMHEMLEEHFGGGFLAASLQVKESLSHLRQATRDTLKESGCSTGNL